jgi:hypothetical protein
VFQFLPNLLVVLMIYVLIPLVMERATTAERHLTRSGALRSLVTKEFWYFLVNLLLLLAFGKAALSATVQQVRQCQWKVDADACEQRFISILGDSFVATSAMSICGQGWIPTTFHKTSNHGSILMTASTIVCSM